MSEIEPLFKQHADLIYRICVLYLRDRTDAEDALQSTFLKYLEKRPVFQNDDHARAWLITTAKNLCRNQLSYWYNRLRSPAEALDKVAGALSEDHEILQAVLDLPEKNREVIYLYYIEGYTTEEISQLLSRNHSTIRTQLVRGRELLKTVLGGIEDESFKIETQLR